MLTVSRKSGASSTADKGRTGSQKGSKGRLELFASRNTDGTYSVSFADYGNFGRERWAADFGTVTEAQLSDLIDALSALQSGVIDTTHVPFEAVVAQDGEPTETVEAPAEEVTETSTSNVRS